MKRYLVQAIRKAGSEIELASSLGVASDTVTLWLNEGMSPTGKSLVNRYLTLTRKREEKQLARRATARTTAKSERERSRVKKSEIAKRAKERERERAKKRREKERQKAREKKAREKEKAKARRERTRERAREKKAREKEKAKHQRERKRLRAQAARDLAKAKKKPKSAAPKTDRDRKTFQDLLDRAKREDLLPKATASSKRREGPVAEGYQWIRVVEEFLSRKAIAQIEAWAARLPEKPWPVWHFYLRASQYALYNKRTGTPTEFAGYSTVIRDLGIQEAGDFAIDSVIASRAAENRVEAFREFKKELMKLLNNDHLLTLVHSVSAFSYRKKTKKEFLEWNLKKRQRK